MGCGTVERQYRRPSILAANRLSIRNGGVLNCSCNIVPRTRKLGGSVSAAPLEEVNKDRAIALAQKNPRPKRANLTTMLLERARHSAFCTNTGFICHPDLGSTEPHPGDLGCRPVAL
jgi:hypothetical protein